jgi:hypothetical protein
VRPGRRQCGRQVRAPMRAQALARAQTRARAQSRARAQKRARARQVEVGASAMGGSGSEFDDEGRHRRAGGRGGGRARRGTEGSPSRRVRARADVTRRKREGGQPIEFAQLLCADTSAKTAAHGRDNTPSDLEYPVCARTRRRGRLTQSANGGCVRRPHRRKCNGVATFFISKTGIYIGFSNSVWVRDGFGLRY